jgi:hypothetical protein
MSELIIMGAKGDTRMIWSPDSPDEVENARTTFNNLRAKGYLAYRVDKSGDKGEVIREFDANAGKIILAPQMAGG